MFLKLGIEHRSGIDVAIFEEFNVLLNGRVFGDLRQDPDP